MAAMWQSIPTCRGRRLADFAHTALEQRTLEPLADATSAGGFKSSGVRPLHWPASSLPIGFARDNSRRGAVDMGTSGR
jgi:hypothetical protein